MGPLPRSSELKLEAAERHRWQGNFAKSEEIYRRFLAADGDNAVALGGLAAVLEDQERFEDALAGYRRAVALAPDDASLSTEFGNALIRNGELEEATNFLRNAIGINPTETNAYLSLSAIQRTLNKFEEARITLTEGVRHKPYIVNRHIDDSLPRILRLRGIQNAYYTLGISPNKRPTLKLSGGNFSDVHLINRKKYTIINFFVLDGNLLRYDGIPEHDLIVNSISDPDVERESLKTLAEYLIANPRVPVINDPGRVMETTRDNNHRRLARVEGIRFPRTVRVSQKDILERGRNGLIEGNGLSFPIVIRKAGTHTGRTFARITNDMDLGRYLTQTGAADFYLAEYVESLFREKYFRKLRVFFIDGVIYPVVCHIDTTWNVHGGNRRKIMRNSEWMQDEEHSFLSDCPGYLGPDRFDILLGLNEIVGLDFFGVDFTLTRDGTILIFELNPVMRHSFEHAEHFPYLTPYMADISAAFDRMMVAKMKGPRGP